jgi:hypothetical protein
MSLLLVVVPLAVVVLVSVVRPDVVRGAGVKTALVGGALTFVVVALLNSVAEQNRTTNVLTGAVAAVVVALPPLVAGRVRR